MEPESSSRVGTNEAREKSEMSYRSPDTKQVGSSADGVSSSAGRVQTTRSAFGTPSLVEIATPGESSGNAASNRTTQNVDEGSEVTAGSDTGGRAHSDDLFELSRRGYTVPPKSSATAETRSGVEVSDVGRYQNSFLRYKGRAIVKGNLWQADLSPACANDSVPDDYQRDVRQNSGRVQSAQNPASSSDIPHNPFLASAGHPGPSSERPLRTSIDDLGSHESETLQRSKLMGRRVGSDTALNALLEVESKPQKREDSLKRQQSLPDVTQMTELWNEIPQSSLDLDGLLDNNSLLPWGSTQLTTGLKNLQRSGSLFKLDSQLPFASLLQDMKTQRRQKSITLNSASSWNPFHAHHPLDQPLRQPVPEPAQPAEAADQRLYRSPVPALPVSFPQSQAMQAGQNSLQQADQQRLPQQSPGTSKALPARAHNMPDLIEMTLISAPASFGAPCAINKTFKPPFTIRIVMTSRRQARLKAVLSAYSLQKEQVGKMDFWQPASHIHADSLNESEIEFDIECDPDQLVDPDGSTKAVADIVFAQLRFNNSSRMKPRWLVFVLELPTQDMMYVQYRVPTVVMSRQCDQTSRAQAILDGQELTRKRPRPSDSELNQTINRRLQMGAWQYNQPNPYLQQNIQPNMMQPMGPSYPYQQGYLGQAPSNNRLMMNEGWPQDGPYVMSRWRDSIQRVCRMHGLTRSFDQEDMHQLARRAGFCPDSGASSFTGNVLTAEKWIEFGNWFESQLRILEQSKDLWMQTSVKLICGFAMTRERSEQLLRNQPDETFIVRPSLSLQSTFVIDCMQQGTIRHLAIDAKHLKERSLKEWILNLDDIMYLLDIDNGQRYIKTNVFETLTPTTPYHMSSMQGGMTPMAMPQYHVPTTGAEALNHILNLSRRGSGQMPMSYNPGFAGQAIMAPMGRAGYVAGAQPYPQGLPASPMVGQPELSAEAWARRANNPYQNVPQMMPDYLNFPPGSHNCNQHYRQQ